MLQDKHYEVDYENSTTTRCHEKKEAIKKMKMQKRHLDVFDTNGEKI